MNPETKIEFYKKRTLGERFSVTGDFIRQNWKVLLKNTLYIGIPLIVLYGFFLQNFLRETLANIYFPWNYVNTSWISNMGVVFFSFLLFLFFFSVIGAILNRYVKGSLTEQTGWSDLKGNVFSFMGKIAVQYLIIMLAFILLTVLIVVLIYASLLAGSLLSTIFIALICLAFVALIVVIYPALLLIPYPVIFENTSAWQGIKKGFKAGFKHWGSTFLTVFSGALILVAIYYILSMPYFVYIMFNMEGGFLGYVLAIFSSFVLFILYSVFYIFVSFQYTAVGE
jgi:hypothetical protein